MKKVFQVPGKLFGKLFFWRRLQGNGKRLFWLTIVTLLIFFSPLIFESLMNAARILASFRGTATAPVLYWKLDAGTGTTANDASGNSNSGTISGATWTAEDLCVAGKCLSFDGSNDNVQRADDADVDFTAGESFTLTAWIKHPTQSSGQDIILSKFNEAGYKLIMESDGDITCGIDYDSTWTPTDSVTSTAATYDDNKWHHVACVKNANTSLTLYIDGVSVGTPDTSLTNSTLANSDPIYAGIDADGTSNAWLGFLDEVKVFDYAFSSEQVKADFNSGSAVLGAKDQDALSNGLVAYWKMDETSWNGTSSEVVDSSGTGRHGTAANGATTIGGKFGNGGVFDGTDNGIGFADNDLLDIGAAESKSFSMWVRRTGNSQFSNPSVLLDKQNTATDAGYKLQIGAASSCAEAGTNDGNICFRTYDGTNTYRMTSSGTTITADSTWHHLVVVFDRTQESNSKIYIDGVAQAVTITGTLSTLGSLANSIGGCIGENVNSSSCSAAQSFNGNLDEVRVYSRALTPIEVARLYTFAPGPIGYWDFEDGGGTTVTDRSNNGNNGTLVNSQFIAGKFGKGVNLTGSGNLSRVEINTSTTLVPTSALTVALWYKAPTWLVHDGNILAKGGSYSVFTSNNNCRIAFALCFNLSVGGVNKNPSVLTTELTDNKWHYIVGTYDGANVRLYVDGSLRDTVAGTGSVDYSASHPLCFGESSNDDCSNSANHTGIMDEVKIYNYARTAAQIVEDMNGGHPIGGSPVASQLVYMKLDEGSGSTANNSGSVGTVANGTTANTTWTTSAKMNRALDFNGTTSEVDLGSATAIDDIQSAGGMTITAWINPDTAGESNNGRIIAKQENSATAGYWTLHIESAQDIRFEKETSATSLLQQTDGNVLTFGTWQHVAVTWDGGLDDDGVNIYINGKEVAAYDSGTNQDGSGSLESDAAHNLYIGNRGDGDRTFDGKIDEVKIYNSVLTAEQLKTDYNAGKSLQLGVLGTDASGNPSNATDRSFCPPGDTTATCGPVGEWLFEQVVTTNTPDTSGNEYTAYNNTNFPNWVNGKVGKAFDFNGSSHFLQVDDNNTLDIGTSDFTLSAWILRESFGTQDVIFAKKAGGGSTQTGYYLRYESDDTLKFYMADGTDQYTLTTTQTFTTLGWNNIVLVVDRDSATGTGIYVNGVKVAATANATAITDVGDLSNTLRLTFGSEPGGSVYFDGKLDQIRVYNYARSASQVAWNYSNGKPIAHWKFDECSGSTAQDSSGKGLSGTIDVGASGTTAIGDCTTNATSIRYDGRVGKVNYSLDFDGTDDDVQVTNSTVLDGIESSGSVAAWVYYDALGVTFRTLLDIEGTTSDNGIMIRSINNSTNAPRLAYDSAGGLVSVTSSTTVTTGQWYHLVATWDSSGGKLYLDGKLVGSNATVPVVNIDSTASTFIGSEGGTQRRHSGKIDDIRIFNYALTTQQIKSVMNGGAVRWGPSQGAP